MGEVRVVVRWGLSSCMVCGICPNLRLVSSADLEVPSVRSPDPADRPSSFGGKRGFALLNFPKADVPLAGASSTESSTALEKGSVELS